MNLTNEVSVVAMLKVSPKIRKLIAQEIAVGKYRSESALMTEALAALADRRAAIAGIERGLADVRVGRYRSRAAFQQSLVNRHPQLASE
ncbi:MAG: hypothetical protein SFU86_04185 [Pirellulaceae bacterium]|nr:hypothetical protein [Pirellulaceae bacterium]